MKLPVLNKIISLAIIILALMVLLVGDVLATEENFTSPESGVNWVNKEPEGSLRYSSPIITDEYVYQATFWKIHSMDFNGNQIWCKNYISLSTYSEMRFVGGVYGDDGFLYFTSWKDVIKLNTDGNLQWSKELEHYHSSTWIDYPPTYNNGTIYVGGKSIWALDAESGEVRWEFDLTGYVISEPVVDVNGIVYTVTNTGRLYAINPNGTQRWMHRDQDFDFKPLVSIEGGIYAVAGNKLYAVDIGGEILWQTIFSSDVALKPLMQKGNIFVLEEDKNLNIVNPDDGEIDSSTKLPKHLDAWREGIDDRIYAYSGDTVLSIDARGNILWTTNIQSSFRFWKPLLYLEGHNLVGEPVQGSNGEIYVATEDGVYQIGGAKSVSQQYGWIFVNMAIFSILASLIVANYLLYKRKHDVRMRAVFSSIFAFFIFIHVFAFILDILDIVRQFNFISMYSKAFFTILISISFLYLIYDLVLRDEPSFESKGHLEKKMYFIPILTFVGIWFPPAILICFINIVAIVTFILLNIWIVRFREVTWEDNS